MGDLPSPIDLDKSKEDSPVFLPPDHFPKSPSEDTGIGPSMNNSPSPSFTKKKHDTFGRVKKKVLNTFFPRHSSSNSPQKNKSAPTSPHMNRKSRNSLPNGQTNGIHDPLQKGRAFRPSVISSWKVNSSLKLFLQQIYREKDLQEV